MNHFTDRFDLFQLFKGGLVCPLCKVVDGAHADHRVDHSLAFAGAHGAEALKVALVGNAGNIENLQAEAKDLHDLLVDRRHTDRDVVGTLVEVRLTDPAIDVVGGITNGPG